MSKQIFTKSQAVAILVQAKAGKEVDIFAKIDPKHALFKNSCDELEVKLQQYIDKDELAGVVDDPVFHAPVSEEK